MLPAHIENDPDPDECPTVVTLPRIEAMKAKPMADWTEPEREWVRLACQWASEMLTVIAEAMSAAVQAIVDAVVGLFATGGTLRPPQLVASISLDLGQLDVGPLDGEWLPPHFAPLDSFSHLEGLPGISEKCWADEWNPLLNEYGICNAPAATDLGTCLKHQLGGNNG